MHCVPSKQDFMLRYPSNPHDEVHFAWTNGNGNAADASSTCTEMRLPIVYDNITCHAFSTPGVSNVYNYGPPSDKS